MSFDRLKAIGEERGRLWTEANQVLEAADGEGRSMNDEEREKFDRIHDKIDALANERDRVQRHLDVQKHLEESQGSAGRRQLEDVNNRGGDAGDDTVSEQIRSWALNEDGRAPKRLRIAKALLSQKQLRGLLGPVRSELRLHRHGRDSLETRIREIRMSTALGEGGDTIPEDFHAQLEVALLAFGGIRQARTSILRTATGAPLPMPTTNDTSNKGELVGEGDPTDDEDVATGRRILGAYKYSSKRVDLSYEVLQDSAFDLPNVVGGMLGTRIGRITGEHFTVGDGDGKPNGVALRAAIGKEAAGVDEVTHDELLDLKHSVDPAYRQEAEWMFHDTTLREFKKLKDEEGRPLWTPGIAVREPDTIDGDPYVINQEMPVMAAENRAILYGAFSKFFIRDVMDILLIRLDEVRAEQGEVSFLAFSRHDSDLLDAGTGPIKALVMDDGQ